MEDEKRWCATCVAHCLQTAGVKFPKDWFCALAYLSGGTKLAKPTYGCVAVKTRIGDGHICFVVGKDKTLGKFYLG
ncbi:TIGR02594 family protein [Acinetobacter tjernbergiae]|uniref:Peptidase C51 domain-containing protein n=1 Tax=Acinetobacter tjernbergiae DSM 14971 = CIP 107465 TaxID=1120928 RepID=V2UZQ8_9GAMM|nr:hypothetical protein F990_02919 [Acinetobacter tjernbergiae DSM 14971 = CIP 107465]